MVGEGDSAQQKRVDLRFQAMALINIQEVVDTYVVNLFEDANLLVVHMKRVMLMPKDIQLVWTISGDMVKYLAV